MLIFNGINTSENQFIEDKNFLIHITSEYKNLIEVINRIRHDFGIKGHIDVERKINGKLNVDELKEINDIKNLSDNDLINLSISIRKDFNHNNKMNIAKIIAIYNELDIRYEKNQDMEIKDTKEAIDFFMFQHHIDLSDFDDVNVKYYKKWYLEREEFIDVLSNYINLPPGIKNYNDQKIKTLINITEKNIREDDFDIIHNNLEKMNMDFIYFYDMLSFEEKNLLSQLNVEFEDMCEILFYFKENDLNITTNYKDFLNKTNDIKIPLDEKIYIYDTFGDVTLTKQSARNLTELMFFLKDVPFDKESFLQAVIRNTSLSTSFSQIVTNIAESRRQNPDRLYMFSEEYYVMARNNMYKFAIGEDIIDLDKYFKSKKDSDLTIKICNPYEKMKELFNEKFGEGYFNSTIYHTCIEYNYDIKTSINRLSKENLDIINKFKNPVLYELAFREFDFKNINDRTLKALDMYASHNNIRELISLNTFFKTTKYKDIAQIVKNCDKIPFIHSLNSNLSNKQLSSLGLSVNTMNKIITGDQIESETPLINNLNNYEKENLKNLSEDEIVFIYEFKKKFNMNIKKEFIELYDIDKSIRYNLRKIELNTFYPNLAKFENILEDVPPKAYEFLDNLAISIKSEAQFKSLCCELDNIYELSKDEDFLKKYPKLTRENLKCDNKDYKYTFLQKVVTDKVYNRIKKNMFLHASNEKEIDIKKYILECDLNKERPVLNNIKSSIIKELRNYKQKIPTSITKIAFICKEKKMNVDDFMKFIDFEDLKKIDKFHNEAMLDLMLSGLSFKNYSEEDLDYLDIVLDKDLEKELYSQEKLDSFIYSRNKEIEEVR